MKFKQELTEVVSESMNGKLSKLKTSYDEFSSSEKV